MQPLLSYSIQIAKQAAHGHVAAGDGLARAVRPADDKREVVVHRLGKAGADILAAHDAHRPPDRDTARAVIVEIRARVALPVEVHLVERAHHFRCQPRAGDLQPRLGPDRARYGAQLRREILRPLVDVHADAGHDGIDRAGLGLDGQLREDAAKLFRAEDKVVRLMPGCTPHASSARQTATATCAVMVMAAVGAQFGRRSMDR